MLGNNKDLYKYGSNKIKELDSVLWETINSISFDITFKEKFFLLENSLVDLPKCECGKSVKFIDMVRGYRRFCSKRCMLDSQSVKDSKKKTCLEKWGVDNPSKSVDIKEKVKNTNIEKFGVEWATQSEVIKNGIKEGFIEKFGVDNPSKIKEVRDKAKKTLIDKFGVDNPMYSDDIKNGIKEGFIKKFGVDNPSKLKQVRDKAKKTLIDKFGVEYPLQNGDIKEKFKNTNLERFGVEYPLQNSDIKEKFKNTNREKWGVDNASKSDLIRNKIKKSNIERYKNGDLIKQISNKNIEKWGVSHISKNDEWRKRYKITNNPFYIKYVGDGKSLFKCDSNLNHEFEISIDNYITRSKSVVTLCTVCNPIGELSSIKERNLIDFIKSIYDGEVIQSYRDGLEIDIYLPKLKIGFEFNGLYWHSDLKRDKNYHLYKTNLFKSKGIRIIHIWEDDWTFRNKIVKSQITNWLKLISNKIWARNCEVKLIKDTNIIRNFLNENHIQGYVNLQLAIGLFFNGNLVSMMGFDNFEGRNKMERGGWNLSRFCNLLDSNVVGSASKLLNFFIKNYEPKRIISYADKCWSEGELYISLGFNKIGDSRPDYKYIVEDMRVHKSRFRNSNLKGITESEYIYENGINRIWDCGKLKFEMCF